MKFSKISKKASTMVNMVLIIGLILIGFVGIISLQKLNSFHYSLAEYDRLDNFAKDLRSNIEQAETFPSDFTYNITVPFIIEYSLRIGNGVIEIYFPRENINITEPFLTSDLNIIHSYFSNSGKIYIKKKGATLFVSNNISCSISDNICDPGCAVEKQCDPICYTPFINDLCNPYCLDYDQNGITDKSDTDGICDPDCYNTYRNGGYIDIDCIESDDGICDPDTDGIVDGICDTDCIIKNGICDPDCREYDTDCTGIEKPTIEKTLRIDKVLGEK